MQQHVTNEGINEITINTSHIQICIP